MESAPTPEQNNTPEPRSYLGDVPTIDPERLAIIALVEEMSRRCGM